METKPNAQKRDEEVKKPDEVKAEKDAKAKAEAEAKLAAEELELNRRLGVAFAEKPIAPDLVVKLKGPMEEYYDAPLSVANAMPKTVKRPLTPHECAEQAVRDSPVGMSEPNTSTKAA